MKKVELPFQQGEFLSLIPEALRVVFYRGQFKNLLAVPPATFTKAQTGKINPTGDSVYRGFN